MCGIIGFTGRDNAIPKLMQGLASLEYRGYDSAGIAYFENGLLTAVKSSGRLSVLESKLCDVKFKNILSGIGHTRWATHGEPSEINSHPHGNGKIYGVHNGIIENYNELSVFLEDKGYDFKSDTDTERGILLIDYFYSKNSDPIDALCKARDMIKGSFALAVMFNDRPNTIYAMRKDSPLLVCPSDEGMFLASDISAVLQYTKKYIRIDEGEIAVLTDNNIDIISRSGTKVNKNIEVVSWNVEAAERGGYPHFMIKEIFEEADAVSRTLRPRIKDMKPHLELEKITPEYIKNIVQIHIVACGTAMHAGLAGKCAIEKLSRIPVNVEIASEFRYREPILNKNDLVIIISQSGETADTIAALRLAKERGIHTLAIVNVPGSTIAREADSVLYTWAGPEIAVASTKAYTVQIALLYLLAVSLGESKGTLSESIVKEYCFELENIHKSIKKTLMLNDKCKNIAEKYKNHKNIFFIGRGHDYALSMEAALKMKEISYIHCEAYAAGELKHGTISLIEDGTPVFAYATDSKLFDKTLSNIKEVKARGAVVMLVVKDGMNIPEGVADDVIELCDVPELFMPLCSVVPAQLLAYYTASMLGLDVDKPRNLAKSVTVE